MASVNIVPSAAGLREPSGGTVNADTLPDAMNGMRIRDDKVYFTFILLPSLLFLLICFIIVFYNFL